MPLNLEEERASIARILLAATGDVARRKAPLEILRFFCDAIVRTSTHIRLAWTSFGNLKDNPILPQYSAGPSAEYAHALRIDHSPPHLAGPTRKALASDKPAVCRFWDDRDLSGIPWRQQANRWNLAECMSLPLFFGEKDVQCVVNIYADEPGYFEMVGNELFLSFCHLAKIALRESHEAAELLRFRDLLDHSSDMILVVGPSHDAITFANRTARERFGLSEGAPCGFLELFPESFRDDLAREMRDLFDSPGSSFSVSTRTAVDHDPSTWITLSFQRTRDPGSTATRLMAIMRDISGKRREVRALTSNLRLHERILESLNEGFCELDRKGRIVRGNPTAEKALGYPPGQLTGHDIRHILSVDPDTEGLAILNALNSDTLFHSENASLVKVDGSLLPVIATVFPIGEPVQGSVGTTILAFEDVSFQTEIEQRQKDTERLYAQIFWNAPDGIYLFDPATHKVISTNPAFDNMLGYGPDELEGRPITVFINIPFDVIEGRIRAIRENGQSNNVPRHYRRKDGTLLPVTTSATSLFLKGQEQILVTVRDIAAVTLSQEVTRLGYNIDRRILSGDSLQSILPMIAEQLSQHFEFAASLIFEVDEEGTVLLLALSSSTGPLGDKIKEHFARRSGFSRTLSLLATSMTHRFSTLPFEILNELGLPIDASHGQSNLLFSLHGGSGKRRKYLATLGGGPSFSPRHLRHLTRLAERLGVALLRHDEMERTRLQQAAMEATLTPMFITDRKGVVEWVNSAFESLSGYSREDIVGKDARILCAEREGREGQSQLWTTIGEGREFSGEVSDRKKDGTLYTAEMRVTPIFRSDGEITHFIAVQTDITDRKEREKTLQQWAFYDSLTRLPNRFLLSLLLEKELERSDRSGNGVGVCFLDLDDFKPINDRFGHSSGDLLLQNVSERLESAIRRGDTVGRLGGDEFVCILPDITDKSGLEAILERLLSIFRDPFEMSGMRLNLSASMGLTLYPLDGARDPKRLIHHADLAMYQAKQQGRNRYIYADEIRGRMDAVFPFIR